MRKFLLRWKRPLCDYAGPTFRGAIQLEYDAIRDDLALMFEVQLYGR